jgi:hypothetical protein
MFIYVTLCCFLPSRRLRLINDVEILLVSPCRVETGGTGPVQCARPAVDLL